MIQGKDDLEEGGVAQTALGLHRLHHPFKGHVRMGIGPQSHLAHPGQQLAEGGVPRQIRAQGQRIDKEADQALDLGSCAVGDGGAHHQIRLARVAPEQGLEGGQQRHEQRDSFPLAQLLESLAQGLGKLKAMRGPAEGLHRWTWTIGGQF